MPKGKRKGKFEHKRTEQYSSDEDAGIDMTNDNCSETSLQSDLKSTNDEQEDEIQEKFEDKVLELIEGLEARSGAARASSWAALRLALARRPAGALLASRRETLAGLLAKALRRAKDNERKPAAAIAPLLALQLDDDEGTDDFMNEVRPALVFAATDKSSSYETRTECCSSLAVLCFLFEEDLAEVIEVMRMYETIFSGSYLKGDGSVKVSGLAVEGGALAAAALDGWALLGAALPPRHAEQVMRDQPPSYARLAELLEAASLEVRLAAGGALAVMHELVAEEGELAPADEPLLAALETLARDSHKYRAKRDRKLQRATFRDILKYFSEGAAPASTARLGAERVAVDGWAPAARYAALAAALGGALHALAPSAPRLRAALGLPAAPPAALTTPKLNKLQRHLQNSAACKARTVARSKNRDKRSAALAP